MAAPDAASIRAAMQDTPALLARLSESWRPALWYMSLIVVYAAASEVVALKVFNVKASNAKAASHFSVAYLIGVTGSVGSLVLGAKLLANSMASFPADATLYERGLALVTQGVVGSGGYEYADPALVASIASFGHYALGYFMFDSANLVLRRPLPGNQLPMYAHHAVGLFLTAVGCMWGQWFAFYLASTLVVEATTPLLVHNRMLDCYEGRHGTGPVVKALRTLNNSTLFVTFLSVRGVCLTFAFACFAADRASALGGVLAADLVFAGHCVILGLNWYWCWLVVKRAGRISSYSHKKDSEKRAVERARALH